MRNQSEVNLIKKQAALKTIVKGTSWELCYSWVYQEKLYWVIFDEVGKEDIQCFQTSDIDEAIVQLGLRLSIVQAEGKSNKDSKVNL